ncbi:hypothetical protein [Anaeroplasma bactoclasticum]|nr:hypothetical protein [Anaeroplasma bactoclasticum]
MRKLVKFMLPIATSILSLSLGACAKQDLSQINEEPNNIIAEAINVEGFTKLESIQKDDFLNGTTFKKEEDIKKEYKSLTTTTNYSYHGANHLNEDCVKIYKKVTIDFSTFNLSYFESMWIEGEERGVISMETAKVDNSYTVLYSISYNSFPMDSLDYQRYGVKSRAFYHYDYYPKKQVSGKTKGYFLLSSNEEYMNTLLSESIGNCIYEENYFNLCYTTGYKKDDTYIVLAMNNQIGLEFNNGIVTKKMDYDRTRQTSFGYYEAYVLNGSNQLDRALEMSDEYKKIEGINLNDEYLPLARPDFSLLYYISNSLNNENYYPKEVLNDLTIVDCEE